MWSGIRKIWDKVAANTLQNRVTGTVKWRLERSGCFSVKSAYNLLLYQPSPIAIWPMKRPRIICPIMMRAWKMWLPEGAHAEGNSRGN